MPESVDAVVLLDGRNRDTVGQLLDFTRTPTPEAALQSLGEAIVINPLWNTINSPLLVGRTSPYPLLAVFGSFSSADRRQLLELAAQLDEVLHRRRYVDYQEAERVTGRLAEKLIARYGREALATFSYTAIPRGGLIVLGMLSYLLDLRHDQIITAAGAHSAPADTLVIVDDCALSGVRFRDMIARTNASRVVCCTLFAPRELCRAVECAEARVETCIAAEDLVDLAPERHGDAYAEWRAERTSSARENRYWVGIPEYIGFAWSEPETRAWGADVELDMPGWNVLPPELCLKRRTLAAAGSGALKPLTLVPESKGPIRPHERVLWVALEDGIAVAAVPTDTSRAPCFRLEGTAQAMWQAILEHGTLEGAEEALSRQYEVSRETLRADLEAFASDLENNDIIVRR